MQFPYGGDNGNPIETWFQKQRNAITTCYDAGLPEASLVLLYSGIDTLGWLGAPLDKIDADQSTFIDWCEKYLVSRLTSTDGTTPSAADLYGARCGVLHTSTATSRWSRNDKAREINYQFRGQTGINFGLNVKRLPLILDIEHFALSFEEGGIAFIADLNKFDAETLKKRSHTFFRWVTLSKK